jgi:stage V sporulation protein B
MRRAMGYALGVSLLTGVVLWLFARPIGVGLLADARTVAPLKILAPALPVMAIAACLKGHLLAVRRAVSIAVGDALEQVVEIGLTVAIVRVAGVTDAGRACQLVALATTVSEVVATGFLFSRYLRFREKRPAAPPRGGRYMEKLLEVALPVAGSAIIAAALRTAEICWCPPDCGLRMSPSRALSVYGMCGAWRCRFIHALRLYGAVNTLILPEVSEAQAAGKAGISPTPWAGWCGRACCWPSPPPARMRFLPGSLGNCL